MSSSISIRSETIDVFLTIMHSLHMSFFKPTRWKIIIAFLLFFLIYGFFWFIYFYFVGSPAPDLHLPLFEEETSKPPQTMGYYLLKYFPVLLFVISILISYLLSCTIMFFSHKLKKHKLKNLN
jgi:succinate-acetate transporter protein